MVVSCWWRASPCFPVPCYLFPCFPVSCPLLPLPMLPVIMVYVNMLSASCSLLPLLGICVYYPHPSMFTGRCPSALVSCPIALFLYCVSCPRFYRRSFETDERSACLVFRPTKSTMLGVKARRDRCQHKIRSCRGRVLPACLLAPLLTKRLLHATLVCWLFVACRWLLIYVGVLVCLLVCLWAGSG